MSKASLALATLARGIYQHRQGRKQEKEAEELRQNNPRPEYEIPQEVQNALGLSKRLANQTEMPGYSMQRDQINAGLNATQNNMASVAGSPSQALAAQLGAYGQSLRQSRGLGIDNARYQDQSQQNLIRQQNRYGAFEDKAFNYNQDEPYRDAMFAASSLEGSGQQNKWNAFNNYLSAGVQGQDALKEAGEKIATVLTGGAMNFSGGNPNVQDVATQAASVRSGGGGNGYSHSNTGQLSLMSDSGNNTGNIEQALNGANLSPEQYSYLKNIIKYL